MTETQTRPNHYNEQESRVTPTATQAYAISPSQASQLMQAGQVDQVISIPAPQSTIDNVFQPQPIGKDPYSPVQRAVGLAVRSAPFAIVYIILAIGIAERFALVDAWLYIMFGIPMLLTVVYMSEKTDKYTPAGVEIERIAAAERTEFVKGERQERILDKHLTHQQGLRRMALEATLRMLERGRDDDR